jgi:tRNA A-37 threonylcarbamoyl transferase component Bud32
MKSDEAAPPAELPTRDALHNLCLADPVWAERYEGWDELGHGGSASVVRTRSQATGEEIALKIFKHLSADEWRRYQDEVRNAQRLTSPYIVRIYSPFPRRTFAWIEMEWVEGPNLRQELERQAPQSLGVGRAMEIAVAVARALETAHAAGVVHRDVKPANILLPAGQRPVAKLGDFGLSRLTDAARLTHTGLFVGTPQFAAPEVIEGGTAEAPADVYALGLCLYLMLSGNRPPFDIQDETSPTQWIHAHTTQAPRPILGPDLPEALASLLDRVLDKRPDRRPTAVALQDSLASILAEGLPPAGAEHPTPSAPWTRVSRPRGARVRTVAAWAVAVGLLGVAALMVGRAREDPSGATEAVPTVAAPLATPEPKPPAVLGSTLPPVLPSPEALAFSAELRNGLVIVRNSSRASAAGLRITIAASGGARYLATPPETLGPGEDLYVALEEFRPLPPPTLGAATVTVAATAR